MTLYILLAVDKIELIEWDNRLTYITKSTTYANNPIKKRTIFSHSFNSLRVVILNTLECPYAELIYNVILKSVTFRRGSTRGDMVRGRLELASRLGVTLHCLANVNYVELSVKPLRCVTIWEFLFTWTTHTRTRQ